MQHCPQIDMHKKFLLLFLFLGSTMAYAQMEFEGKFEGLGQVSTDSIVPFWFHANNRGRTDETTNLMALLFGKTTLPTGDDSKVEIGAGAFFSEGYDNSLKLDEAYFSYTNPKIGVVVGKKQREDNFRGLSASNESILWSLNAGAIPGIRLFTTNPFFISGKDYGFGVMASLEEYIFTDNRYVKDTRLHHKSFHLVYQNQSNFQIAVGIQHFVQWAGISPDFGKLPNSFKDYTKIFTGGVGDDTVEGQEVNALGNQLGSYEIKIKTKIHDIDTRFLYNHIFEDGSGLKMGNLPDGRYSLYFEDNRDTFWGTPWIKAFIIEYYYLENQSRNRQGSAEDGSDNYFSNNLYRSGWTYNQQVIGTPFVIPNTPPEVGIKYNIVSALHTGVAGHLFQELPYRFLLSYRSIYGKKDAYLATPKKIISPFLELQLLEGDYNVNLQISADLDPNEKANLGIGVRFSQSFY